MTWHGRGPSSPSPCALPRGCLYGFVKWRGPLDFSITHRDARGRPLLRLGCPRALPPGLARDRVPHDRVDDLEPLSRHGLQRLVVPHPPRPALVVVPSESVLRADEGVAAEYQQVLKLLVAPALRGDRPHAGAGPAVGGSHPAVARRLVVAPEQRDVDRGDRRRGGLRPYAGYREQALAGLVAGQRPSYECVLSSRSER